MGLGWRGIRMYYSLISKCTAFDESAWIACNLIYYHNQWCKWDLRMSCYFKSCELDRPITCLQKHYKAEKQAMRLGLESQHNLNPAPNLTKISTYLSTKVKETLQIWIRSPLLNQNDYSINHNCKSYELRFRKYFKEKYVLLIVWNLKNDFLNKYIYTEVNIYTFILIQVLSTT